MKRKLCSLPNLLTVGLIVKAIALIVILVIYWPAITDGPEPVIARAQTGMLGDQVTKIKGGDEEEEEKKEDSAEDVKEEKGDQSVKDENNPDAGEGEDIADDGSDIPGGDNPTNMNPELAKIVAGKQRELALEEDRIKREREELDKLRIEVNNRIAELKKVQAALEQLVVTERQERRKRVLQLVKVLSNMQANSAGAVVSKLDDQMAVEIFSYMQSRQAGKVMANLSPDKAARISLLLTRKKQAEEAAQIAGDAARQAAPNLNGSDDGQQTGAP